MQLPDGEFVPEPNRLNVWILEPTSLCVLHSPPRAKNNGIPFSSGKKTIMVIWCEAIKMDFLDSQNQNLWKLTTKFKQLLIVQPLVNMFQSPHPVAQRITKVTHPAELNRRCPHHKPGSLMLKSWKWKMGKNETRPGRWLTKVTTYCHFFVLCLCPWIVCEKE